MGCSASTANQSSGPSKAEAPPANAPEDSIQKPAPAAPPAPAPTKADSIKQEAPPAPAKADSIKADPPAPAKADSIKADPPAPAKADSIKADPPAPAKADSIKADPPAPATPEVTVPEIPGSLPADTQIVFVLGGPGSGKGTQCERIVERYGYKHLSAGDLLRDEVASGSDAGKMCQAIMTEGKLVPMSVTIALLKNAMIKSGSNRFLIDGFPRALDQAHAFESDIRQCDTVLAFTCPDEVMEERLINRGKTSGRADDNIDTIRKRFITFKEQSMPVITQYLAQGKCHEISAVPPPSEVFEVVKKVLDPMNGKTEEAAPAEEKKEEAAAEEPAAEAAAEEPAEEEEKKEEAEAVAAVAE